MAGINVGKIQYTQDSFIMVSNLSNGWSIVYHSLSILKLDIDSRIDWKRYQRGLS